MYDLEVEKVEIGNYVAIIEQDDYACDPREWDNVGTMYCEHRRYNLGDPNDLDFSECSSWEDHEKVIKNELGKDCVMLPLYLYDHSGITMNTTGFSCGWDSGRVGTIAVSRAKIREIFCVKRITQKVLDRVEKALINEVKTYDEYLTGDVYRYMIFSKDNDEDVIESCGNFFGLDEVKAEVENMINYYIEEDEKAVA